MKIMLSADHHLSDRAPSSCTDSYTDDLFDLMEQAREVGIRYGVSAWCWAGDTFHLKAPSRVSYKLVHRVCTFIEQTLIETEFPVLILAGNHDIANDQLESVWKTQPLGMLYRAGAVELRGWTAGQPVYGVPWLQGYGGDADQRQRQEAVVEAALEDYRTQVFERGTGNEIPLVVAHAPLYPPGRELEYEFFPAERWAQAMGMERGGHHRVFYGHVHEPHEPYGWYGVGGDAAFCNNGALSRGSLHEYNLTREVGVTIYDTQTGKFEFVPLDAKPAEQVFRLQEKQQATDMQGRLDDFLRGVGAASLEVLSAESVVAHIRTLPVSREVRDLAAELIIEAQHGKR